jgi:hypothetical protein
MGLFQRKPRTPPNYNDPALDDIAWLHAGEARYDSLVTNHYGSPDTIAEGGRVRLLENDPAAALFFFQKSIDTLHSIYVCGFNDTGPGSWPRQPSHRDLEIVDSYLDALRMVREMRPAAPIDASVKEVTHRLRTIATQFDHYDLGSMAIRTRLETVAELAPEVDVSGVFWT